MPSTHRRILLLSPAILTLASLVPACSSSSESTASGEPTDASVDHPSQDAAVPDAAHDAASATDATDSSSQDAGQDSESDAPTDAKNDTPACPADHVCGSDCCTDKQRCMFDTCIPDNGSCSDANDCINDTYCAQGVCVPNGVPPTHAIDPSCKVTTDINAVVPVEQCRWTGPPAGDARPGNVQVMATPIVVDFDLDGSPERPEPSIVFASFPTPTPYYKSPGVLRIIDGKTCAQQFSFPDAADAVMSPASVAAGDITADGRPEIVAAAHAGGLLAFIYDPVKKDFVRFWHSGTCNAQQQVVTPDTTGGTDKWSGPSIYDLDDDGIPEIIYGATVYNAHGCIVSNSLGFPGYASGYIPVVADVDEDGKPELVMGDGIYEWDKAGKDWKKEAYFTGVQPKGQVAVADMGNFPLTSQNNKDMAEVVVVSTGKVRVQTIEGKVVFGPFVIPGGGKGGAPTIADFDGDGRAEFATAGGNQYVVYDMDCVTGGDAKKCGGQTKTDGILWSQPSQDHSSNVTGSSVFDFDADGKAEVVYADECFLRIYDGSTGKVKFSAARSSGTTYENPVMADVDGDFHTEIVSAVNDYAGLGCAAHDPLHPSTAFANNHGIVVLHDAQDRWAASRSIWNQHAYAVTNVRDNGVIPKTSQVALNWKQPGLNNFRQNVQGNLQALGAPDITSQRPGVSCDGAGNGTLSAKVCNRGMLPVPAGLIVSFRSGSASGTELCQATSNKVIKLGECVQVSCTAKLGSTKTDVYVVPDSSDLSRECHESNNLGVLKAASCP